MAGCLSRAVRCSEKGVGDAARRRLKNSCRASGGVGSLRRRLHRAFRVSGAGGEARPESDVDLLVDFNQPIGLFELVELKDYLEELLGCSVDLVPRDSLKRQLRDRILKEAIPAA